MKQQRSSWILYGIIATIAITIAVQVYWNYKNYQVNKQQFINQVQISLDNAVEAYYAAIVKKDKVMYISMDMDASTTMADVKSLEKVKKMNFDSIFNKMQWNLSTHTDTIIIDQSYRKSLSKINLDSVMSTVKKNSKYAVPRLLRARDSIRMLQGISSLYISITEDSLDFTKLKTFLDTEFDRKQIAVPYRLNQYVKNSVVNEISNTELPNRFLTTYSKSTYLKPDEKLELQYANISQAVWKKSLFGILLSSLLSLAIIGSLVYLLRVIRQQKQLAEIKNDLISNITHEFKTPITTISTALEAIQHFGALKDPEKTQKYLSISDKQLKKLHLMVEKLLETATLDSENL